jgi:hypothetical protein
VRTALTIPKAGNGGRLVVHAPSEMDGGYAWEADVELVDSGIHARGVVDLPSSDSGHDIGLAGFFQELAASWRGWPGARTWASLCGCLRLEATHDGIGYVILAATLTPLYEAWSARIAVQVEAGEEMSQLAADLCDQFPPPDGAPRS